MVFKKRDRASSPSGDEPGSKRAKSEEDAGDATATSSHNGGNASHGGGGGSGKLVVGGENLDALKTVNFFRTNLSKLNKNDEYQILYFPLTDPLTEGEKLSRRVVTSERVAA